MFIQRKATKQSLSFRKPLYGVGTNDADYMVTYKDGGKLLRCEIYKTWSNMLKRCYCIKDSIKNPTYKDCYVCDDWLKFSNFRKWMVSQDWKGKQLDKDLIKHGNKVYSPETCVFVDSQVNSIFTNTTDSEGFTFNKKIKKFVAKCRVDGKGFHIGAYDSKEDANKAYIDFKVNHVREIADRYSDPLKSIILNKLQLVFCSCNTT